MTNWRTVLNPLQQSQSLTHNFQNTQNQKARGDSEDSEQCEDSSLESKSGEGPCSKCGSRLWYRLVANTGAWECRRCAGEEGEHWTELLYVPLEWQPIRAGAPNMTLRCPGCQRTVFTLFNRSPSGWRCAECHGEDQAR